MIEALREIAAKAPDRLAMRCFEGERTFEELVIAADHAVAHLRQYGVEQGDYVPIVAARGRYPIIGEVSIASVGAIPVILPSDARASWYAKEFDRYRPKLILECGPNAAVRSAGKGAVRDEDWLYRALPHPLAGVRTDSLSRSHAPRQGHAYVRYSSGSTSSPRATATSVEGLGVTAKGLRDHIYSGRPNLQRIGLYGPYEFDTCVKQLLQLFEGKALIACPPAARLVPALLLDWIESAAVDVLDLPPAIVRLLLARGTDVAKLDKLHVLIGGEAIDQELWVQAGTSFPGRAFAMYGTTECAADSFIALINPNGTANLGEAIEGAVWRLDRSRSPQAPDEWPSDTGEIVLGGPQVGTPLTSHEVDFFKDTGQRWYRTGDICRRTPNGLIFVGRTSSRLKVRGRWVDMEQVRSACIALKDVEDAAVLTLPVGSFSAVFAFVVGSNVGDGLSAKIAASCPEVDRVIEVEYIPRTSRGKLDRRRLERLTHV